MSSLALSFGDGMDILPSSTTYASDSQQQLPIQASPSNQSQHIQDPFFNVDANMTAEAGPSNYNASQQPATFLPPASVQYGAPPNVAPVGQDLLYRDVEGQTKWLGPSRLVLHPDCLGRLTKVSEILFSYLDTAACLYSTFSKPVIPYPHRRSTQAYL